MANSDQTTFNNELRGALFRNDKGGVETRPDYRGRCTIDGKDYKISAWLRKARATGATYLSMSFTADAAEEPPKPEDNEPAPF